MNSNLLNLYFKIYAANIEPHEKAANFSGAGQTTSLDNKKAGQDRKQIREISQLSDEIHQIEDSFRDFITIKNKLNSKVNKLDNAALKKSPIMMSALSPVVPFRRVETVPEKIEKKDYIGSAGVIAVAAMMLPEDLRDTRDGLRQVLHKILPTSLKGKLRDKFPKFFDKFVKYEPKYNHKEYQAPFSFVRGSFLQPLVNKMANKWGYLIHNWDKSLLDTKFGQKVMKLLKVTESDKVFTGRKVPKVKINSMGKYVVENTGVWAIKLEGSAFGKLICRTLQRTTRYGVLAVSAISIPSIVKAFITPDNTKDKFTNSGKQAVKSAISITSVVAGIGLGGTALVSLGLGPAGSIVGMGIGSVIGMQVSDRINRNIKTEN